jgi:hypothetical protein
MTMTTTAVEPLTETNPNRPTEPGYCAQCAEAPCHWTWHRAFWTQCHNEGTLPHYTPDHDVCAERPQPETEEFAVIKFLGSDAAKEAFPGMETLEVADMIARRFHNAICHR